MLYKPRPNGLETLMLVDPKRLETRPLRGDPAPACTVVTDPKWRRTFATPTGNGIAAEAAGRAGVRNIDQYTARPEGIAFTV